MLTSGPDADTELMADLNRLLREGLAAVEWTNTDAPPRFHVTAAGRAYLAETDDVAAVRRGDREKGFSV